MLNTILPASSSDLEKAFDKNNAARFDHDLPIDKLWSAETCPEQFLPFLAWSLSVDNWDSNWPDSVKRQVITSAAYVHRFKGTVAGMKAVLAAFDLGIQISEWFEYGGDPYFFRIDVELTSRAHSDAEINNIIQAIETTKNARSHLERLRVFLTSTATPMVGVSTVSGLDISIEPWIPIVPETVANLNAGLSVQMSYIIELEAA